MKNTKPSRKAITSRANGRLGGRPRTNAKRIYTYQWNDGDMSLIFADGEQEALMALDELGLGDFSRRFKPYTGPQFGLVFKRDAAGRVVLNMEQGSGPDGWGELAEEFGLGLPEALCDDEPYRRLIQLHAEAEALAVKHVRDNLPPEDLALLDKTHPSHRQTWVGRKEIERELAMTLPQLKRHLKRVVRRSTDAFSVWLEGTPASPKNLAAEYKKIDGITEEQQEKGKAKLRAELADLVAQESQQ